MKFNLKNLSIMILIFLSIGCSGSNQQMKQQPENQLIGMPNPASQYCIELGGKLEMVKSEQGTYGVCHLPSGEIIEEWQLYRRDHKTE